MSGCLIPSFHEEIGVAKSYVGWSLCPSRLEREGFLYMSKGSRALMCTGMEAA